MIKIIHSSQLFHFVSKHPSWNFGIVADLEASYIDMSQVFRRFCLLTLLEQS